MQSRRKVDMKVSLSQPVAVDEDDALAYARSQAARIEASDRPQDVKDAALANLRRLYPNL